MASDQPERPVERPASEIVLPREQTKHLQVQRIIFSKILSNLGLIKALGLQNVSAGLN